MAGYRRVLITTAAAALLGLATPEAVATPAAAHSPRRYVALGDSYAAGPGIPTQRTDPPGCGRSTQNYPALVAAALGIGDYTDVSCSGARTDNMTVAQQGPLDGGGINRPQFDALAPDTDLVTVTIGGNDIDLSDIFDTCFRLSSTDPAGNPCQRHATAGGIDHNAQRVAAAAPKVAATLDGIRQRAPRTRVLLVGYLRIMPPAVGCYPTFPVARGDVPYLDQVEQQLTAMLADQAFKHDTAFVNSYAGSLDHDVCQPAGAEWVEGTVPIRPAYPIHPNATGMQEVAVFALNALSGLDQMAPAG